MCIIKNKYLLALFLYVLSFEVKAQDNAESIVEDYIQSLNNWLGSPDNMAKRQKILDMFQTDNEGSGIKDEIVEKYNVGKSNCLPNTYMTILYDEGNRNKIEVVAIGNPQKRTDGNITIITIGLKYSGGISLTTVSDFWISNGKIMGIVSNELGIIKIRKKGSDEPSIKKDSQHIDQHHQSDHHQVAIKKDNTTTITNYEYVDLGLPSGTLWATCNIGANTPWEYGDYFAWGETTPKKIYKWSNYKFGTVNSITKYNHDDNIFRLHPDDDAATSVWGNDWRMPTISEWDELREQCKWNLITKNGIQGYDVTRNEQHIFIPTAGYRYSTSIYYSYTNDIYYWSSTSSGPTSAYIRGLEYRLHKSKCEGLPIRAVKQKDTAVKQKDIRVKGKVVRSIYRKKERFTKGYGIEELAGVNVYEKGTSNGTITDLDGNFSIEVPASSILVFKMKGYRTKEVKVNGQDNLRNIFLN